MQKGKIILIEGTDKSGKETQSRLLFNRLVYEGIPVEKMSFPRYHTPTGRIVGQCYLGKENLGRGDTGWFNNANKVDPYIASLYYAADRVAARDEIKKTLLFGKNLILDRYVESNMAHQGGKLIHSRKKEDLIDFIQTLEYKLLKLPSPDLTIFLHMPHEVGIELGKGMKEKPDGHEASLDHLQNAEETYLYLAERFAWETIECAPNGFPPLSPKEIHEKVYKYIKRIL